MTARLRPPLFAYKLMTDVLVWGLVPVAAYLVRFDGAIPSAHVPGLVWLTAFGLVVKSVAVVAFRLNRQAWRLASFHDVVGIAKAVAVVGALEVAAGLALAAIMPVPRSVLPLMVVLGALALFGVRAARRLQYGWSSANGRSRHGAAGRRALIVGAGEAGNLVVREMLRHPDAAHLTPVAIVDDDPGKHGSRLSGVPVAGPIDLIPEVLRRGEVDEVVLAIASADGALVRRVRELVAETDPETPVRVIPGVYEVLSGDVQVSRLREVRIEDLLRRPLVPVDLRPVNAYVRGHTVLVTGAGGSIGSEIVRQLLACGPERVIALGHGENSLFELMQDLERRGDGGARVTPVITSVRDRSSLSATFERYQPSVVFHAAAHKHLPLMEANPEQAVFNNVIGTRNVLDQVLAHRVARFVSISTDKAVNPSSVLGATKRLAECLVKDAATRAGDEQVLVSVRFGNVLGSRGSAVRVFREQIERGGPVTVTHPDMTRYFMTIPEACQLVLQAGALGENGTTYLLDMGQPVRIVTLAEELIRLSGLRPHDDVEIVYTGVRAGEKMHEELLTAIEDALPTSHPHVRAAAAIDMHGDTLHEIVQRLTDSAHAGATTSLRALLRQAVGLADAAD